MFKRIITGLVLFGLILLILYLSSFSHLFFDMTVLLFMALAVAEMCKAMKKAEYNPIITPLILFVLAVYPFCYFFGARGLLFCTFIAFLVAFVEFIFNQKKNIKDFMVTVLIIIYPGALLSTSFLLSVVYGLIPVLFALATALLSDCIAYFGGSFFGKHKIFPVISPKKTYEGTIAGLLGGAMGGMFVYGLFEIAKFPTHITFTFTETINYPYLLYIFLGMAFSAIATIGDLAASRIKREVGLKDYGTVLAAHGGAMDRIDSILFTLPVMTMIMFMFF